MRWVNEESDGAHFTVLDPPLKTGRCVEVLQEVDQKIVVRYNGNAAFQKQVPSQINGDSTVEKWKSETPQTST